MTDNHANKFILLRSILQSDDQLQIRSSGDFDRVCLKLDYDIHISFFINPLHTSTNSLTINNLHDLRIYKLANKNPHWINIRDYFNQLIQQSNPDTPLYSIVQLIQEYILQNFKSNENKSIPTRSPSKENASTSTQKFRGADLIFNRITHDRTIDRSHVIIGYEDRFTGIHEIPFNEFKHVHDDEYGIPMHRIRYYKINEQIVWDRIKKFDILTGSEINDSVEQELNLIEGMYHFDRSTHRWILHPHISLDLDDVKIPSMNDMCLPERCQFLTWNILCDYNQSELIYTDQRYEEILKTLKSFSPDIICLQEITKDFLDLLFNEIWLKENNYYIIIMGSILNTNQNQSYGQLMLMKNFRPRAFSIYSLEDAVNSREKQYIIARFGLNLEVTIDLVNLHLHKNSIEKRCQSLEYFFQTMKTRSYMLIGDFNFGDYDIKEQNLLEKYQYQIYDLWKDIYDLDENPGYTFDPTRNICAQITSNSQTSCRSDRYLLHRLHNLSYSIEHLNLVGLETISIDSRNNQRINQSDHYALQLIIKFRLRSINHHSALAILPSINIPSSLDYINLLCPFFDLTDSQDDEENILLPLRLLLAQYEPFNIEITNETDSHSVKLNQQSAKHVEHLFKQIQQLFPQCLVNTQNQFKMTSKSLASIKPIQFSVRYIYILQKSPDNDTTSFRITYQIPLGSVLEPIGLNQCDYISCELKEYFNQNEKSFTQKQEKYNRLSICFNQIFNKDSLHYFTHAFLPYGSFRLGLHGDDLDTVFVFSEGKSSENKTNLDQIFLQLRYDPLALNNHLMNLLESQICKDLNNEIIDCRKIQALYPIISILFNDQTRVEIFVQIKEKSLLNQQYQDQNNLISNFHEPVHGVHDIERLIPYVRFPPIYQHFLTFIRIWAQNVGIYGQVYGYIGGYSWAVLCACICHRYLPANISLFSVEQFFILIKNFFSIYSHFNWTYESVSLYSKYSDSDSNRGSMRILCPSPPFNNTSRSTINSTRYLIIQNFENVNQIIEKSIDYQNTLKEILRLPNQFPDRTIQSILQLRLSSQTSAELNQWIGYMKSRLAHFLTDCEDECNLFIQTDTNLHQRKEILERFYFIGFQLNEQLLSRHRQFYFCLNKFLDQFKIYSFRTDTMKISYKLMSIHDWNIERNCN